MEAGQWKGENADLITAMINGGDESCSDEDLDKDRKMCMSGMRMLFRYVYGQFHELTD